MKSKEGKYFGLDGYLVGEDFPTLHITQYFEGPISIDGSYLINNSSYNERTWRSLINDDGLHYTAVIRATDQIGMFKILKQQTRNRFNVIFEADTLYRQRRPYQFPEN